uniref:Transposase n=1 Tax=Panagrellus redivivus TaxID=6233 RepID=A0A7E4VZ29_PANRE
MPPKLVSMWTQGHTVTNPVMRPLFIRLRTLESKKTLADQDWVRSLAHAYRTPDQRFLLPFACRSRKEMEYEKLNYDSLQLDTPARLITYGHHCARMGILEEREAFEKPPRINDCRRSRAIVWPFACCDFAFDYVGVVLRLLADHRKTTKVLIETRLTNSNLLLINFKHV